MGRPRALVIAGAALTTRTVLHARGVQPVRRPVPARPAVQLHRDGATVASQWNGVLAPPAARGGATPLTEALAATPGLDGTCTYVHVSMAGAAPGATQPLAAARGAVRRGRGRGRQRRRVRHARANDQGRAAAAATVPLRLAPRARYHVRVSASAADPETVVAWGDLTPPTH
jgi:hypothetical protein